MTDEILFREITQPDKAADAWAKLTGAIADAIYWATGMAFVTWLAWGVHVVAGWIG